MPFLSPNKDSSRTHHQIVGQRHQFQTCPSDQSRFSTYRNISLAQTSDRQSLPPSDVPNSFDDKYENVYISPMFLGEAGHDPGGSREILDITPIEIMPLTNLENLTPVKYSSLDLSDISFSSLNESLEGLENVPSASNLDTPSLGRMNHSLPTRRREYVLSKRPLGALGVAGTITTSTPSSRGVHPWGRTPLFQCRRGSGTMAAMLPDDREERRKTIHSTQIFSPPKKVQRSESTPDGRFGLRGSFNQARRAGRVCSTDAPSSVGAPPAAAEQSEGLGFLVRPRPIVCRSISTPSKPVAQSGKAKRAAPNILNRKGRSKLSQSVSSSQGTNHFTPSKFLNNPQSSTPVSKRLRDRGNSLLDEMAFSSPLKLNPSCKKQIFPDDDEDSPAIPLPPAPTAQPVLSLETSIEDFQVDFSNIGLDTSDQNLLASLDTPSKDLNGGFHEEEEQLFSPVTRMLVDSPIKADPIQDVRNDIFSIELVFGNEAAESGSTVPPVHVQPQGGEGPFYVQEGEVGGPREYFVCDDGTTYVICTEGSDVIGGGGGGGVYDVIQCASQTLMVVPDGSAAVLTSANATDVMENDLPDTFMKVVCCETTHRKSLIQQAREVLGVPEAPVQE